MMTSAEFKTLRESLGLSAQWVADRVGVSLRTVQYWDSGKKMSVPDDVGAMLRDIDDAVEREITQTVAGIDSCEGAPFAVQLVHYRTNAELWRYRPDLKPMPVTTYGAMLSRLRRVLEARSIWSVITYLEPGV